MKLQASRGQGPRVLARWGRPGHLSPGSAQRQEAATSTAAGRPAGPRDVSARR